MGSAQVGNRAGQRPAPRSAHRDNLLAEAAVILDRAQEAGSALVSDAGVGQLEPLMRDLHSYKSLIAFAGRDQAVRVVTDVEACLGHLWQGRTPLDAATVARIQRVLGLLAGLHTADARNDAATADAIAAEVRGCLGANVPAPRAATASPAAGHRPAAPVRTLTTQVEAARLAEVESLAATAARLLRRLDESKAFVRGERVEMMRQALDQTMQRLQQEVHSCRCCPLEDLFTAAVELVPGIASQYGRRVTVTMDVAALDIELAIAQVLRPAIMHLFRNAVAHGIETPEQRAAAGKPETGTVSVVARRDGDRLVIVLSDDGRGFDPAALRQAAVAVGAISPERGDMLSDEEAISLAFVPGLSTSKERTNLSGSGMGLTSISDDLASLGGKVRISSQPGRGVSIAVELPLPAGS